MFSLVSRRSIVPSRVLAFRLMSSSSSKGDKKFRPQHETTETPPAGGIEGQHGKAPASGVGSGSSNPKDEVPGQSGPLNKGTQQQKSSRKDEVKGPLADAESPKKKD